MSLCSVRFTQLPDGEFSGLESLMLTDNRTTVDLQALLARCPRLRVLKVSANVSTPDVRVSSRSLLELYIYVDRVENCRGIDIITPLLKRLKLAVYGNAEINMRISAPMLEKASLCWSYTGGLLVIDAVGWRSMCLVVMSRVNLILVLSTYARCLYSINCPTVICLPSDKGIVNRARQLSTPEAR
jgi:hypothetical protein